MCIAIYKPRGVSIKKETLEICFKNNPDGAGLAIRMRDNKIKIMKGFFKFDAFYRAVKRNMNFPLLIHCRIATSGKVNDSCCHPFPIDQQMSQLKQHCINTKAAMIHNGTIINCKPVDGANYSDTMYFTTEILSKVNYKDSVTQKLINMYIGKSRIAIMDNKDVILFGEWQTDDLGIHYSNDSYKKLKEIQTTPAPSRYAVHKLCRIVVETSDLGAVTAALKDHKSLYYTAYLTGGFSGYYNYPPNPEKVSISCSLTNKEELCKLIAEKLNMLYTVHEV